MPKDPSLLDLLPKDLEIHTSKMWRPENWIPRIPRFGKSNKGSREKAPAKEGKSDDTLSTQKKEPAQEKGRLKTFIQNSRNRILATPDPKIWWCRPAYYKAVKLLKKIKPDVIFSTAPPHSSHLLGIWLKRKTGIPLVLDFRDPWSRSPWSGEKSEYIEKLNQSMERQCVESADAVILNTDNARDEFIRFYDAQDSAKFHSIPNGYDPDSLSEIGKHSVQQNPTGNERFTVSHLGTIYGKRDIRPFLQALAAHNKQHQTKIFFEQIGHLKVNYDLKSELRKLGIEDSVFVSPQIPHTEALNKMATSDALLLLQPDGNLQIPGKLFEMILYRKPIITLTGQGATRDVATKFQLGPIAEAEDVDQIRNALDLLTSEGPSADWKQVLDAFNGQNQTETLSEILDSAIE